MRPFTKKNPPINESLKELDANPGKNKNIRDLIDTLGNHSFTEAVKDLVNLTDNPFISTLINKKRDEIRKKFSDLNIKYVQTFNSRFTNANFPSLNIARDITPIIPTRSPNPTDISSVLTATAVNNDVNISTAPFNVANQTVINIGTLLVLDRLIDAAHIRSLYKDARYNEVNVIDPNAKGAKYGKSKPHLISLSGLYCAYCESTMSDGAATDVEHKVPKSAFETMEKNWSNFVLACERCNTGFKSNKYVHPEGTIEKDDLNKKAFPLDAASQYQATDDAFTKYSANAEIILQTVTANISNSNNQNNIISARGKKSNTDETSRRDAAMASAMAEVGNVFKSVLKSTASINTFCSGANNVDAVKEDFARIAIYNSTVKYANDQIIWPDRHYNAEGIATNKRINSFQGYGYELRMADGKVLPAPIQLNEIKSNTDLEINDEYRIDIKNLQGRLPAIDVQLRVIIPDYNKLNKTGNVIVSDPKKVKHSAQNMIEINGLNQLHKKDAYMDQRIIRRTKTWLHAMKMLKQLTEFNLQKFDKLHSYYQEQLHPVNIRNNPTAPNRNIIDNLRDNTAAPIVLQEIIGVITIAKKLPNGEVNIDLKKSPATTGQAPKDIKIEGIAIGSSSINAGTLTGEIKESGGTRTMTGSIEIGDLKVVVALSKKIILIKDAVITDTATETTITIDKDQGVISKDNNLGMGRSPADILKEWDNNRNALLGVINQTTAILKDFMWENILDMVRTGGFYSIWVRTFHDNCPPNTAHDIDLVRKLEMNAKANPEDPYQFHGTDVEEIIACL
jgi:HNH endonuclease